MLNTTLRGTLTVVMSALLSLITLAQDTIRVQTLTYDSITTRRGTWVFPDTTYSFRKVLMSYKLKCDAATTQDQYACGEWDYLTYNTLYEHTGVLDSNEVTHPEFLVGDEGPDSVEIVSTPLYDTHQWYAYERVVDQVSAQNQFTVGAPLSGHSNDLSNTGGASRAQYLYTASELTGLSANDMIEEIELIASQPGDPISRVTISMKNEPSSTLTNLVGGTTVVYEGPMAMTSGLHRITLTQPFQWDGTSNLLVGFDVEQRADLMANDFAATPAAVGLGVRAIGMGGHVRLHGDHIGVTPDGFQSVSDEVTIMCWVYGDPAIQPQDDYLFEGRNAQDQRVLNVHLPWSDGRVYWDAGQDGGYDRIDKAAIVADYAGQWNHWAFTKNTTTESMKIYLNGALWHSGTAKTRPMNGIERFAIGADASSFGGSYSGSLDEFAVFNAELDAAEIQQAYRGISPSHPDLLYLFHFDEDETTFNLDNAADPLLPAWPMGTVQRAKSTSSGPLNPATSDTLRPDLTFYTGTYTTHLDSTLISTQHIHPGVAKENFQVSGNFAVPYDTVFGWQAAEELTYDPAGTVINQIPNPGVLYLNDTLEYFGVPYEVVNNYELGRFITPYGIGLSLGPDGFRWMYDVTDYQFLLHDSVELSAGNQQELIDLEFIMIEGTPPREVVNLQRPWGQRRAMLYRDLDDDTQLPPSTIQLDPAAHQWMLRTRLSGHGHNSNTGSYPHCCEWKDNTHSMYAGGTLVKDWHIWQTHDCALNPVFPQGGTWPGAREGWCPGDVVKDNDIELTDHVTGSTVDLDYRITPVPANNQGMGNGSYVVAMQLFEYGQPTHNLDAEIYEVKRPTDWEYRERTNPVCSDPLVTLRNAGGTDLTSVTFTYGVSGGQQLTYNWSGNLAHAQMVDVALPVSDPGFWGGDDDRIFTVTVSAPNGGTDEYADNDSHISHFELPPVYEHGLVIWLKTNNFPFENSYTIKDIDGNVVHSASGWAAGTQYWDTLNLPAGCYTFELLDTGDDGLSYWANQNQGNGFVRFRSPTGGNLQLFDAEFGHSITEQFAIGWVLNDGTIGPKPVSAQVFPNPNAGEFTLQVLGVTDQMMLQVTDALGREMISEQITVLGEFTRVIDLGDRPAGTYTVRISSEEVVRTLPVVKY